jgi:hypothetical protein
MDRTRTGRVRRRRWQFDLLNKLDSLEIRVERLEAAVAKLAMEPPVEGEVSCCDDLIGCLDDCVDDVAALRKKVRDVRR